MLSPASEEDPLKRESLLNPEGEEVGARCLEEYRKSDLGTFLSTLA
jgi:hypothetical protein